MKKKFMKVPALLLAAVISLTACGGSGASEKKADASASESGSAEAAEAGKTSKGGAKEITFAVHNEPDGIDPSITSNSFADPFLTNGFEGLVTLNSEGELAPGQAESWEISPDGKTYTFKLRKGLKWSDGSPLTANDFVYTAQRVLAPETAANYVDMYTSYIVNAKEIYDGTKDISELGMKAIDDNTLEINLLEPASFFLEILTMSVYAPVQKATVEANKEKWTLKPETYIGNGPFKMTEINMGESWVMEKNENYWDAANVKLDKITFRLIKDLSTALTAFEAGEIDASRSVPTADVPRLKASSDEIYTLPVFANSYYCINNAKAPYDDVKVRKAINLAIDRQAIIDSVINSSATPQTALIPKGYSIDGVDYTEGRSDYGLSAKANAEEAQKLLAEAGYPGGEGFPEVVLYYYTSDTVKLIAEAMGEMLTKNLGVKVSIKNQEWNVFKTEVQAGNYDIAAMGWQADYLHPMTFFPLFVTGSPLDYCKYSNPAYDEKVSAAMKTKDAKESVKFMKEAEDILMADYPFLPLYSSSNTMLVSNKIDGWMLTATGRLYFRYADLVEE